MTQARYAVDPLTKFAHDLLAAGGMEPPKAEAVSRLLVLTDMIGRPTHGVALVPRYVEQLEKGLMDGKGEPDCLTDKGATLVWDGLSSVAVPVIAVVSNAVADGIDAATVPAVRRLPFRRPPEKSVPAA